MIIIRDHGSIAYNRDADDRIETTMIIIMMTIVTLIMVMIAVVDM